MIIQFQLTAATQSAFRTLGAKEIFDEMYKSGMILGALLAHDLKI